MAPKKEKMHRRRSHRMPARLAGAGEVGGSTAWLERHGGTILSYSRARVRNALAVARYSFNAGNRRRPSYGTA